MLILLIVLVALVVVAASATLVVTGRRRRSALPPDRTRAPLRGDTTTREAPAPGQAPTRAPPVEVPSLDAPPGDVEVVEVEPSEAEVAPEPEAEVLVRPRFRDRLGKARSLFAGYLGAVRSRDKIDVVTWDELEEALILADVGVDVTSTLLDALRARVRAEGITTPDALVDALKADLIAMFKGDRTLHLDKTLTNVWLFVGVNGVGKTTTIGKIGLRQAQDGHRVVMAAGDTFRAAAADQLALWSTRVGAELVRGNEGGDPAAVIFDAVAHAAAKGAELVLADTAGRLHNKVNLMEELKKVRRVADREPGHVSEVLLVIDATTGQNGLIQAAQFAAAVGVTGVVLTKLDGTAKGGIAVAICAQLGIPIKLVGLGEGAGDLVEFDPTEFVEALFEEI